MMEQTFAADWAEEAAVDIGWESGQVVTHVVWGARIRDKDDGSNVNQVVDEMKQTWGA